MATNYSGIVNSGGEIWHYQQRQNSLALFGCSGSSVRVSSLKTSPGTLPSNQVKQVFTQTLGVQEGPDRIVGLSENHRRRTMSSINLHGRLNWF